LVTKVFSTILSTCFLLLLTIILFARSRNMRAYSDIRSSCKRKKTKSVQMWISNDAHLLICTIPTNIEQWSTFNSSNNWRTLLCRAYLARL
jgi:hypothetical protein